MVVVVVVVAVVLLAVIVVVVLLVVVMLVTGVGTLVCIEVVVVSPRNAVASLLPSRCTWTACCVWEQADGANERGMAAVRWRETLSSSKTYQSPPT